MCINARQLTKKEVYHNPDEIRTPEPRWPINSLGRTKNPSFQHSSKDSSNFAKTLSTPSPITMGQFNKSRSICKKVTIVI